MLLADLDLELINIFDQFVPTNLAGDVFPKYAGGWLPGTAGVRRVYLGTRVGETPGSYELVCVDSDILTRLWGRTQGRCIA